MPSNASAALTVESNASFFWPLALPVDGVEGIAVAWATAQPLTKTAGVVFFVETPGVRPEVAVRVDAGATVTHAAAATRTDEVDGFGRPVVVLRRFGPSHAGQHKGAERSHTFQRLSPYLSSESLQVSPYSEVSPELYTSWDPSLIISPRGLVRVNVFFLTAM